MASTEATFTIGTRGSALAMRQTNSIARLLSDRHPSVRFEVRTIQTEGDRNQRDRIADIGDKGVFVRPIERALIDRDIDIGVHSLKDVPSDVEVPELTLAAFSPREDPRDALISRTGATLSTLPRGARIGTGSLRRRVQVRDARPDVRVLDVRGNVDTRLRKLDEGEFDAIVLAVAGLRRLGLENRVSEILPIEQFVPDAGQGIIAVQTRRGEPVNALVATIDDAESRLCAEIERAVIRALGADCHSPVGAYARPQGDKLAVFAMAAPEDCSDLVRLRVGVHRSAHAQAGSDIGSLLKRALNSPSLY